MIFKMLDKIQKNPNEDKFKSVKKENKTIYEKIGSIFGAESLLKCVGFDIGETEYQYKNSDSSKLEEWVVFLKNTVELIK